MLEKVLIILRGIPGCGKSTLAEELAPVSNICTADDFHMVDGEYVWKPENVKHAHGACQTKAANLMLEGASPIVIANTSTTVKEMGVYLMLAEKFNYTAFSVIVENRHGGVSTHGVPEETLQKMKNRFDVQL